MSEGGLGRAAEGSPAPFPSVAVVGMGLMGTSLALALRRTWPQVELVGLDIEPALAESARARGVVDRAGAELELCSGVGLAVLATPVGVMPSLLRGLARLPVPPLLVTDLGSVKVPFTNEAQGLGSALTCIGGHPMCGRQTSGPSGADPEMFRGATWVLTPPAAAGTEPGRDLEQLVMALGAQPQWMEPGLHDHWAAGVSHAAFVTAAAYMQATSAAPGWAAAGSTLAASGFRDLTRIAGGDPVMYAQICSANREEVVAWVDRVMAELAGYRAAVASGSPSLEGMFAQARAARLAWEARA